MFCKRVIIDLKKNDDVVNLRPLGDIHIGNIGCDLEEFEKQLQYVEKHDNCYTVMMGDAIDNVQAYAQGMVDKRWNPETTTRNTLTTEEQTDLFVDKWSRVADKSLGMIAGNHEWKTINQRRFIKDFCNPVKYVENSEGIKEAVLDKKTRKPLTLYHNDYLGRLAYLMLSFRHKDKILRNYLGLVLHGGYAGAYPGGAVNRLKAISGDFDCDFILMGHSHDTGVWSSVRTGYDLKTNNLVEKKVILGMTGTFLRGYAKGVDSYVEINPRSAKRVGTITLSFNPYSGGMYGHD